MLVMTSGVSRKTYRAAIFPSRTIMTSSRGSPGGPEPHARPSLGPRCAIAINVSGSAVSDRDPTSRQSVSAAIS